MAIRFATENWSRRIVRVVGRKDKNGTKVAESPARPGKVRADVAVFEQGLAPSRERARALILAGQILCGDIARGQGGRPVARGRGASTAR